MSPETILGLLATVGSYIWSFINSSFSTALLGALAGAWGAQAAAARSEKTKKILDEIRSTNAAISVAFSITNSFCNLKDQHIKGLAENYASQKREMEKLQVEKKESPAEKKIYEFKADFRNLPSFDPPLKVLQDLLFEKLSISGRPLTLIIILSQCVDGLNSAKALRDSVIARCRSSALNMTPPIYFGLPLPGGHTDTTYPDCIDAISKHTDDCIFFSKLIGEDLMRHGDKLAKQYGNEAPTIASADFSGIPDGIIPDEQLYRDWIDNFKSRKDSAQQQKKGP